MVGIDGSREAPGLRNEERGRATLSPVGGFRWPKTSIRGRIRLFQILVALGVLALSTLAIIDLQVIQRFLDQARSARSQLAAISQLAISANRYSEQIAELLLVGPSERDDFDSARGQVNQAFRALRESITIERTQEPEFASETQAESERVDRMRALFREIDRAVERLLVLAEAERREDAVALFRMQIENRLDAEFERLIGEALAEEQAEARQIEAELVALMQNLTITTLIAALMLIAAVILAGMWFARSLLHPIRALTAGARAIEDGRLDHRIATAGGDELTVLSDRFNAMAERLGHQRGLLVEAQGDLERKVAARTAELAAANQTLVKLDDLRVRFLGDISHELRTPITAVRGEAQVALRGISKPESVYREALTNVVSLSGDLARLVDDLLFVARTEADEISFEFRPLDLSAFLQDVTQEARLLGRERAVDIVVEAPEESVTVRADSRRLKQALMIVVDNAVKYSEPGARVGLAVLRSAEAGLVEIAVSDRGAGIPAADLPHVFERFYRGTNAKRRWAGGAGLGLPIANWILQKHEGSITIESEVGSGTLVRLRLPGTHAR